MARQPRNPTGKGGFKKGRSGNPGGFTKEQREQRLRAAEALDEVFQAEKAGDYDKLAQAILDGVERGDAAIIRLACEYRWGKPTQIVENAGDMEVQTVRAEDLTDDDIAQLLLAPA